jgi:predicted metal-dependent phosphoesterase TrpH
VPLKIDLHVHTVCSKDSFITGEDLVYYAKKRGLDGVAITDHDSVGGFQGFRGEVDLLLIPGIEVSSGEGHVLGYGLDVVVEKGRSFVETIDLIHEAGGLAVVAHPTAFFKGISEKRLVGGFDAVEVVNASAVPFRYSVRKNRRLAVRLGLPQVGGSDAHNGPEIGVAYTLVDAERKVDGVLEAIRRGHVEPGGRGIPWGLRLRREFKSVGRWLGKV